MVQDLYDCQLLNHAHMPAASISAHNPALDTDSYGESVSDALGLDDNDTHATRKQTAPKPATVSF